MAFHFLLLAERHPQRPRWIISLFADTAYLVLASTHLRPETCTESYAEPLRTRFTMSPLYGTVRPIAKIVWEREDLIWSKFCLFHKAYFDSILNEKLISSILPWTSSVLQQCSFKSSPCLSVQAVFNHEDDNVFEDSSLVNFPYWVARHRSKETASQIDTNFSRKVLMDNSVLWRLTRMCRRCSVNPSL